MKSRLSAIVLAIVLSGCAAEPSLPPNADKGPDPVLPPPQKALVPVVRVAPAIGWGVGEKPTAAPGLALTAFSRALDHPRWIHVLPNGDVLVAETNAPPRPERGRSLKGKVMAFFMKKAGAATPSANRITLLRDVDGDGEAETRTVFLEGLNSPFGMALIGNDFYVANSDAVMRFAYTPGETRITAPGVKLADLPAGPLNHHWTKNLIASRDGTKLYATVGSNSNAAENGIEAEDGRAAIWEIDAKTGAKRLFASGLRNPNGMAWEPRTGKLWTVVNERDELGHDLVPDYLTSVAAGGFYGWPYSYYGSHVDDRVSPPRPDLVAKAIKPDYALGNHVAALGLAYGDAKALGGAFGTGAFVGQHGSWNRDPRSGYRVVFVPFKDGKPAGLPVDVLTGFLDSEGKARGRPVGVALDDRGALYVADDVGNVIWRVTASAAR
jgi:glucose/arabinose dehydrogenase